MSGRDFFLQAIWLTSITTRKFYNISGRHSTQNIWIDVTSRTGWFSMTKDQRTLHCQRNHFWLLKLAEVSHPPHSPDLVLVSSFLPRMKPCLWWCGSHNAFEIQNPLPTILHVIPKHLFQQCFQQWQKPSTHCITQNTTTTNNKRTHIFHDQLRHGTFENTLYVLK
jgi:hypothetical protein